MLRWGLCAAAVPLLVLYGIRKYVESKWGKCKNKIKLDGKIAIVTGANSGIGFETTKELALRNATVILACRDMNEAKKAIEKIRKITNSGNLVPMFLDLSSLKLVEQFVTLFTKSYEELHILINNAGVSYPKNKIEKTEDGLEIHFGVNYLSHFYLTTLLLDVLEKTKDSKVIITTSKLHEKGKIDLNNLSPKEITPNESLYANSKLANVYFGRELAFKAKLKEISVYLVCPGWVYTNLFRHSIKWFHYILIAPIAFLFMRNAKQGSQTLIYCATEPGLETGIIYRDCKMYESLHQFDNNLGTQLWKKSQELVDRLT